MKGSRLIARFMKYFQNHIDLNASSNLIEANNVSNQPLLILQRYREYLSERIKDIALDERKGL